MDIYQYKSIDRRAHFEFCHVAGDNTYGATIIVINSSSSSRYVNHLKTHAQSCKKAIFEDKPRLKTHANILSKRQLKHFNITCFSNLQDEIQNTQKLPITISNIIRHNCSFRFVFHQASSAAMRGIVVEQKYVKPVGGYRKSGYIQTKQ